MFPGLGKIDPKKMQGMLKQMGINQQEIEAKKVIIETEDKNIIIESPSVQKITMQGQESFQISGEIREEPLEPQISEEDISLVMEKAKVSREKALEVLEESSGDIAEAISKLL